jgi:hypothetical protein
MEVNITLAAHSLTAGKVQGVSKKALQLLKLI